MRKLSLALVAVLAASIAASASAQQIGVGDPAPKIEAKEFVKGTPVRMLEKGRLYVVEFWATWCGPCRVSIPHLTELQKKHKDVTFIGVSVWENDQKAVKPFVDQMGDKMAYTVAMDDVAAGARGSDGKMAQSWMRAAGQDGIPAAFIVNRDGKIAWIGHPMQMDKPLEQVVAGTWDLQAAVAQNRDAQAQNRDAQARQRKMSELRDKFVKAQQSGDPKQLLAVIDQAITDDPSMEARLGPEKLRILATQPGEQEKALSYGSRLVETIFKDNPQALNAVAWTLVDPKAPRAEPRLVKLALKAALRADELAQGKDAAIADTLAKAYFDDGNPRKALETQERAVKLAQGTPYERDPGIKDRLEQYKKAAGK